MRKIPFKFKVVVSLLFLFILFTILFFYSNYRTIRVVLEEEYRNQLELVGQGVETAVQNADTAIRIIESQLRMNMERYTRIMLEKYKENPYVLTWDLEAMKGEFDGYDIFIIDQDLVVIHTTYGEDLGLDFKEFPRFSELLRERLEGDSFVTDRLDISIKAKETKMFSYMPTPDNRYLLELAVSMNDYFPFLEEMELERVTQRHVKDHQMVDDITIYRIHEDLKPSLTVSQVDPESEKAQIVRENEATARAAIIQDESQEVIRDKDTGHAIYRYIPHLTYRESGELDYWNSYLTELVFNDERLMLALDDQRNRFLSTLFTTMLVMGILFFGTFYLFRKTEEGRERLETVINRTSEGYYMLDSKHRIAEVNAAFCQLLGYPRDKIIGETPASFMDEKNKEIFYQESLKSGRSTHHSFEVVFLDSSHREIHVLINSTSIKGHHEGSGYYFAFVSDITLQKKEKEELKRTRDAAEAASQFKSEFLATMSHEIRTPMNGIVAMTEVLLETPLDDDQRKYASIIWDSSGILMNIINDILDFSKIEAGKMSLKPVDFSLREMLSQVTELYSPRAKEKGLSFTTDFSSSLPDLLYGDHMRVRQVLGNLINNAINFTDEGSIRVGAKVIEREEEEETIHLQFFVEDTGIGIEEEKKNALFQPFTQVDSSTTRKYGGTGLGLAICRRLVDLMGGSIGFTSQLGEGSSFYFTIPLTLSSLDREEVSSTKETTAPLEKEVLNRPILIAEDNKVNQQIARIQLGKLGFTQIYVVQNGREALEAIFDRDYSLVLMDCQMPVMDGYTASKEIRRLEKERGQYTPIVAMTAHSMEGDKKKCLSIGMDAYMSKPVKLEVLQQVLHRILSLDVEEREEEEEMDSIESVIDFDVLEGVTGVSREDLSLLYEIFHTYLKDTSEKMEELKGAITRKDFQEIRSAAHFLKSSSGNLGAVYFSSLSKEMEFKAKEEDPFEMETLYLKMEKEYDRVKKALLELLEGSAPKDGR